VQLLVAVAAVLAGAALGLVLLAADRSSWSGARQTTATVTGVGHDGVKAVASGRQITLHLAPVPSAGTRLAVQVSPDGRARPVHLIETPARAVRQGVTLVVLLTLLVQAYRFVVTRRPAE
jgi:hypothetical protein